MNLKRSFFLALGIYFLLMAIWEIRCRRQGYIAALNDDLAIWAVERSRLSGLTSEDVVILGSSRAHFDMQLDVWKKEAGISPVMLACDGSTPTPVFLDIVNNSDFNGTVIIGVTPGLFFSAPSPKTPMWRRAKIRIDHYYNRTLAQRLNHYLSLPLEYSFAFLNSSEEEWADDIDVRSMIRSIKVANDRVSSPMPPFYNFSYIDIHRNTTMFEKTVTDTAFTGTIKKVWMFFNKGAPPPVKDTIFSLYRDLVSRFTERGGKVIFSRFPSGGDYREAEHQAIPRGEFWDSLLIITNTRGYHFEDYPQLGQYETPEWSHLATPDARIYTSDFLQILENDHQVRALN